MSSHIQKVWEEARGAVTDGRLDNLAFKHKQLYALFDMLQKEGVATLEASGKPSKQLTLELEETLRSISHSLDALPHKVSLHFDQEQKLKDIGSDGRRRRAVGVIVIIASQAHPFASWAIPLSQAIVNGNAAVMISPPGSRLVPEGLKHRIDASAYTSVELPAEALDRPWTSFSALAGMIGPASSLPKDLSIQSHQRFEIRPLSDGPVPIIIDQSILHNGTPLSPREEAAGHVPDSVKTVAKQVSIALAARDSARSSLGAPTYILAHENVVSPLMRALNDLLPSHLQAELTPLVENQAKIKRFLDAQQAGIPDFMPVYAVRSIDMAIDFIQDDVGTPAAAYVFANHRFAAYAFNSLKTLPIMHLNSIPRTALALGPYADCDAFAFFNVSSITAVNKPSTQIHEVNSSIESIRSLRARKLKQDPGSRIDFFGGSFMFSGGLTASLILGGVGYGLVKGALFVWSLRAR